MSKISQDFINDLGSLYESIYVRDQDFLNEESEYYDEETAELTEDIILSIALSMFSEGCTAETFVKFLANSDEEVILEKYLNININFISEETIYNDFVEEQLELLEVAGLIRLLGRGAKAVASGVKAGAKATRSAVKSGVTKAAGAGVEKRVGKQFAKSTDPLRTADAVEKIAKNKATKAGITVPQGTLTPKQSTDLIKQARTARAIRGVKSAAKGALIGGAGVLTGYLGAKMGSGGQAVQVGPKPGVPSATQQTPSTSQGGSGGGGRTTTAPVRPSATQDSRNAQYQKDRAAISTAKTPEAKKAAIKKAEETGMAAWAKAHPELAAKVKPGQSGYDVISKTRIKPGPYEKQDQTPTVGKPDTKIDTSSVEADIKREQERLKKKAQQTPVTAKESYDSYDVILEYLIGTDQVDTLEEAHYVMMEMDVETVGNIRHGYYLNTFI